MRHGVFLALAAIGLSACAAPATDAPDVTASMQKLTASTIGAPDPAAIEIHDAQRSTIKWEWRATWQGQSFACSSDERLRLPLCATAS